MMTLGPIKIPPIIHPPTPPLPPAPPAPTDPSSAVGYAVGGWGCTFYGGPASQVRVQITLFAKHSSTLDNVAWIRFFDDASALPTDYVADGIIRMHLPMTSLAGTLEILKAVGTTGALQIRCQNNTSLLDYDTVGQN